MPIPGSGHALVLPTSKSQPVGGESVGKRATGLLEPFLDATKYAALAVVHGQGNKASDAFDLAKQHHNRGRGVIWLTDPELCGMLDGAPSTVSALKQILEPKPDHVVTFVNVRTRRTTGALKWFAVNSTEIDAGYQNAETSEVRDFVTLNRLPRTHEQILQLIRSGGPEEAKDFILRCPEFPLRGQAASLATMDLPGAAAMALGMAGQALAFGRNPHLGAEIALAAHTLAREVFEEHGPEVILPLTLSRIASEAVTGFNNAGAANDALEYADEFIELYGDEPENGPTIRVARVTALVSLNRIEDARKALEAEQRRGVSGPAAIELHRLEGVLARMQGSATDLAAPRTPVDATDELAAWHQQIGNVLDYGTSLLTGPTTDLNEWTVMRMIREGTGIFTHPERGRDPELLRRSLDTLIVARDWSRSHDSTQNENDALWGIYLCRSRLDDPSGAADALLALRQNIESARATIADPIERGGIAGTFPHLYPALCRMLALAGRTQDLLEAIEGAKGRAVADLLVERFGMQVDEREFARPSGRIAELMQREGAHYLSFFVDESDSYAVLVTKDGELRSAGLIPLGMESVRSAAAMVDPRDWGFDPGDPLAPAPEPPHTRMTPLVGWLDRLVDEGVLHIGDHICYSADEHLHHLPLHYVEFRGTPLVDHFSVSRCHGAWALALCLEAEPADPRHQYVAVEVPDGADLEREGFLAHLHSAVQWLDDHLDGQSLLHEAATLQALRTVDFRGRVAHFATHGVFPVAGADNENPYTSSGVLLADESGLPRAGDPEQGGAALLSPEIIRDAQLDFSRAHVTLQACVTGLAREGLGGDALGMDWALTQAGASSLLVSHWDVNVRSSSEFFVHFYTSWIQDGKSRKDAWLDAVRALRSSGGPYAQPYHWAPFSLSGDWR